MRALVILSLAVSILSGCNSTALIKISDSEPVALSTAQKRSIETTVTRDFFDPTSAQFRNVRASDVVLADGQRETRVCGEVNGKNRMGGYVGFQYFGGILNSGQFVRQDFFSPCEPW